MKREKVELLAPAGNAEAFYGAIHAGADAVYLGGEKFGARAYADNFTTNQLVECIRYAHIWGKRVYLTVNTLVKEKEWDELYDYILPFYEAGLDGVIIQDLGVFLYLKENFPDMELHISTQMTLTGKYGAAYMKSLGACRIVPARELSLEEIRHIKQETGLEIETFIHGAMCYCYSGQCLFSSILGGRSGNRGRCAQPCRLPYRVESFKPEAKEISPKQASHSLKNNREEYYPLSLKDMCTIEHIDELIEAGIDSFKIEGRMKKPEYAAGVTAIYRKAIDRYYANPNKKPFVTARELNDLSHLYIRSERQNGYYHKHNAADMVTLHNPAYSGSDEALLTKIREKYLSDKPRINVDIYAQFKVGTPAQLTLICDDISITVDGANVDSAQKQPISAENLEKQLSKLGDTVFSADHVYVDLDEQAFYPLKAINELRRQAVTALENQIIEKHGLPYVRSISKHCEIAQNERNGAVPGVSVPKSNALTVSVTTYEQLLSLIQLQKNEPWIPFRRVYVEGDLLVQTDNDILTHLKELQAKSPIFAVLPYILRMRDNTYLEKLLAFLNDNESVFDGCMVRSLEGYAYLLEHGYQGKISADTGFYIWNQKTLNYWSEHLDSFCLPRELNAGEQRALINAKASAEKIVYGHIPMMISAGCVLKTTAKCLHDNKYHMATLTDRYQKQFPVVANCLHCMNIIYNSVPLSLHNTLDRWTDTCNRLDFTIESGEQTYKTVRYFSGLLQKKTFDLPYREYTTGHEKRGVE